MLGFLSYGKKLNVESDEENRDIAKLFFDSFSKRVGGVEERMRTVLSEIEKLKASIEGGQVSDLVLLDRLQRGEQLVRDSLASIRTSVENVLVHREEVSTPRTVASWEVASEAEKGENAVQTPTLVASRVLFPIGELGSLPIITTPTELQVITLLADEGPKSAPEIGQAIGRSREHTARLMKKLYQEGYVRRDQARIPFRYSLVEKVKQTFKKTEVKDEGKEQISVAQT